MQAASRVAAGRGRGASNTAAAASRWCFVTELSLLHRAAQQARHSFPVIHIRLFTTMQRRLFNVRRYALHDLSYRNSVCLSVRLSHSCMHCVHMVRPTIMISSPYGSPIILVSGDIKFISKFEGGHPERGRTNWVRINNFRPISRRISKTVRDTTKVTINHY